MEKWICRTWKKTAGNGWISEFDAFNTKAEAVKHGDIFLSLKGFDDLERNYEVYKEVVLL